MACGILPNVHVHHNFIARNILIVNLNAANSEGLRVNTK